MARPTDDPIVFSSDASYPAGADPWNGTPTKVEPSAGQVAAGWEPEDLPPAQWLNYILNNLGAWVEHVKAGSDGVIASNWFQRETITGSNGNAIAYDPDGEILVIGTTGENTAVDEVAIWSDDGGMSWNAAATVPVWAPSAPMADLIWDGSQFVGVGGITGSGFEIVTSPDGDVWTERTSGTSKAGNGVVYDGSGTYVAVGDDGTILSSSDAITWTSRTADASYADNFEDVTYGAGLFVAVGVNQEIQTSPDGTTWTQRTVPGGSASNIISAVHFADGIFVAAGHFGAASYIHTSADGITWTEQTAGDWSGTGRIAYSEDLDLWAVTSITASKGVSMTRDVTAGDWRTVHGTPDGGAFLSSLDRIIPYRGGFAVATSQTGGEGVATFTLQNVID